LGSRTHECPQLRQNTDSFFREYLAQTAAIHSNQKFQSNTALGPVKRAVVLAGFEVLRRQLFERGDVSTPRVLAAPQKWSKQRAFERSRGSFLCHFLAAQKVTRPPGRNPAYALCRRHQINQYCQWVEETRHPRHAAGIKKTAQIKNPRQAGIFKTIPVFAGTLSVLRGYGLHHNNP
jgi:hypothetical protein